MSIADDIYTIDNFLSESECNEYISLSENIGYTDAPVSTIDGPIMIPDVRNNARVILDDRKLADFLWQRIERYIPSPLDDKKPIGLNERFRFYRYDPGQRFNWHRDGYYQKPTGEK